MTSFDSSNVSLGESHTESALSESVAPGAEVMSMNGNGNTYTNTNAILTACAQSTTLTRVESNNTGALQLQQKQHNQGINNIDEFELKNISKQYNTSSAMNSNDTLEQILSDEREKIDTTPENTKKIDDIIEQECFDHQEEQPQKQKDTLFTNTKLISHDAIIVPNSTAIMVTSTTLSDLGYVDDANIIKKDCDSDNKPPYNPKDIVSGASLRCESGNSDFDSVDLNLSCNNTHKQPGDNGENIEVTHAARETHFADDSSYTSISSKQAVDANLSANLSNKIGSYSFTIENIDGKDNDPAVTAARYKSMMERFQNRHRRGASMSKLEVTPKDPKGIKDVKEGVKEKQMNLTNRNSEQQTERLDKNVQRTPNPSSQVKLRPRDRSASRVRDASKRHSWSPRSSTQELTTNSGPTPTRGSNETPNPVASIPRKSMTKIADGNTVRNTNKLLTKTVDVYSKKKTLDTIQNRSSSQFTPRSTVMQMALAEVDVSCMHPPLDDDLQIDIEDAVSEAGTYTVYGDNYTEEQKDRMNIDNGTRTRLRRHNRPHDLDLSSNREVDMKKIVVVTKPQLSRPSNVLEVNYYHETNEKTPSSPVSQSYDDDLILGSTQSGGSYYAKIRARVLRKIAQEKDILSGEKSEFYTNSKCEQKQNSSGQDQEKDMGYFTSVTTSGVLAKQRALDSRPKLTRCSSLSTSQIDSSEYVVEGKPLMMMTTSAYGTLTDHSEKLSAHTATDDYRLNVFSANKKKSGIIMNSSAVEAKNGKLSDTALLKTARSKNDWIREWARNARARSLANDTPIMNQYYTHRNHDKQQKKQQDLMTRSYTCSLNGGESLTDDNLAHNKIYLSKINKTLAERHCLSGGELECASDPSLSSSAYEPNQQDNLFKSPKSPTKIPSPLHSIGRARNASRSRPSLTNLVQNPQQQQKLPEQSNSPQAEEDEYIYLRKTAAAINNLQISLSRKNSLKSPVHTASVSGLFSGDHSSPHHSFESPSPTAGLAYQGSPRNRSKLLNNEVNLRQQQMKPHYPYQQQTGNQLMTGSYNEHQLKILTNNGDYLQKQLQLRKNSYDANINFNSPSRRAERNATYRHDNDNDGRNYGEQSMSPIRRSSSFSATKICNYRAARPQFQNIYKPPPARVENSTKNSNHEKIYSPKQKRIPTSSTNSIQKSASSNSFRQMYSDYDDNLQYYINDEDECDDDEEGDDDVEHEEEYSISSDGGLIEHNPDMDLVLLSPMPDDFQRDLRSRHETIINNDENINATSIPITNTRYNKALLMRIERSKQKVSGKVPVLGQNANVNQVGGVQACPNTPELPRRGIRNGPRCSSGSARQSMPRDTSLNRFTASQVPNSLASAKKQLLQTAAGVNAAGVVQSKYLDISKYKTAQGSNFLRKNESKSTLKGSTGTSSMRRSPSSSSMMTGLTRADPTRASNRSVRSMTANMSGNSGNAPGANKSGMTRNTRRDISVTKQKEAEMAMWKRRSTYDPMKAAAEDRRRKEEAKKLSQTRSSTEPPCERKSRSQTRRRFY